MNLTVDQRVRQEAVGMLRGMLPASAAAWRAVADGPAASVERAGIAATAVLGGCDTGVIEAVLGPALALEGLFWRRTVDAAGQWRDVYGALVIASALWTSKSCPGPWMRYLRDRVAQVAVDDQALRPALALWRAWVSWLGGEVFGQRDWQQRGIEMAEAAMAGQATEGSLHPLDADTSLDAFVYDELTALHAAGELARRVGEEHLIDRVHALARYHVANTQPDNTTHEPWGAAAFAGFADTAAMAWQQLHDVRTLTARRPATGVMLALLADIARA